jgi:hypothetical protein
MMAVTVTACTSATHGETDEAKIGNSAMTTAFTAP